MAWALVGREAELRRGAGALDALADGTGAATLVLAGEPGHGKSTLLAELHRRAAERGFLVLAGRAAALGGPSLAFGPVAGALARYLDGLDPDRRSAAIAGLASLAHVVERAGDPPRAPGDPELERARAFQAVALLLGRLAVERPIVLSVDDLHWADPSTVELLVYLHSEVSSLPVMLTAAVRPGDLDHRPDVRRAVADLDRGPRAWRIDVTPLDGPTTVVLAERLLGAPVSDELGAAIVARTGGVPLAVEAVARDLATASGASSDGADPSQPLELVGDLSVPAHVVDLFRERIDRLDEVERAVLLALATADGAARAAELAAVAGDTPAWAPDAAVVDALRRLVRRHLARIAGDGDADVYDVAHPLVADAALAATGELERRNAHARWVDRLLAERASDELVAVHVTAAGPAVPDEVAVGILTSAGTRALAGGAVDAAIRWLGEATRRARAGAPPAELGALLGRLSKAWHAKGEPVAAVAAAREAVQVLAPADPASASIVSAEAAFLAWFRGGGPDVVQWSLESVELARRVGPEATALALAEHCHAMARNGSAHLLATAVEEFEDAVARVPADATTALMRFNVAMIRAFYERRPIEGALALFPEGWADTPPALRYHGVGLAIEANALLGRWDDLRALFDHPGATAIVGPPTRTWRIDVAIADAAFACGDWDNAADMSAAWDGPARRLAMSKVGASGWLAAHRGDGRGVAEAVARAEALVEEDPALGLYLPVLEAVRVVAACAAGVEPPPTVHPRPPWTAMRELWVQTAEGERLIATGERDRAIDHAASLARFGGPHTRIGAVAARLGALAAGGAVARPALFEVADQFDMLGMRFEAARARLEACEADPSTGDGDLEVLVPALECFETLGAEPFAVRARRLTGRRPPPTRRASLTPRERDVAALVAKGLTNAEVAERLCVSIRTVTSHLDHAYTKLGIGSRAALAAYVVSEAAIT